ncbi:sensor histidine kinase [Natranaerofaba carboxydovora]|uniref:sensor histidine kinase n=1 Tax=Natranaerofaba carboxydovora TaxID=2742683 RepID=UPI001F146018|nr:HAMP domain-containing sensor histidine kinase [Natranaerofaba carboxydovora]UMZ74202.1 Sensor histidine kinase ResE [Natranaerofaba carboxydovora]
MQIIDKIKPKSLFSKLISSYMIIIFVTLLILGGIMSYLLEQHFYGAREWEINSQAQKAASMLEEPIIEKNASEIIEKTATLSKSFESNINVYDSNGNVITKANYIDDTDNDARDNDDNVNIEKNEKEHVLKGNSFTKKVFGPQAKRLLVAIPITVENESVHATTTQIAASDEDEILGFVTLNAPLIGFEDTLASIFRITLISGAIAVFFATIFAFTISRNITKPLKHINESAKKLASGNYKQVGEENIKENEDELNKVSKTFNVAANQIDQTIKEQKKLAVYRKNLVDNASHEFRAPLSTIRGYCELLIDGILPREKQKKYIQIIMNNTLNLNKMVDELLELSNLESGSINLENEKLTPEKIAKQNHENILPMADEKSQNIELQILNDKNDLGYFLGDVTRVNQILSNILKNAVQFTQPGGKIKFSVGAENNFVVYTIEDNGKGIPEEEMQNIFQRFYKLDKSRNDNSTTGLGLAIVNELVKAHDGDIKVESKVEEGSIFKVYFPRYES